MKGEEVNNSFNLCSHSIIQTLAEISSPLRVGTEILIGGLPPGVPPNTNAPITTSFNGCIYEVGQYQNK